jgi:hypothetical protein
MRSRKILAFGSILCCTSACAVVWLGAASRAEAGPRLKAHDISAGRPGSIAIRDTTAMIDANGIGMYLTNQGSYAQDPTVPGDGPGFFYPRGSTRTAVYAAGIWVGAKVDGAPRVTTAEYESEFVPGVLHPNGNWEPWDDPRFRVYKIHRGDSLGVDYLNWPIGDGAQTDSLGKPPWLGDQTLWAVYHDVDSLAHVGDAGGTWPLGIEVRQTTWASAGAGAIGNVIFLRYQITNRGPNTLNDMYVSSWSDPDLGGPDDDMTGCDPELNLGYCYNATNNDPVYQTEPPAVGFWLLDGPIVPSPGDTARVDGKPVPGYRNLPISAFSSYTLQTDPGGAAQSYNLMEGLTREGQPIQDPESGYLTSFVHSGDPVNMTGWLDETPGDKRMLLTTGPFTMAPGDSQIVTFAVFAAQGLDRLDSVALLKEYVGWVDHTVPVLLQDVQATRTRDTVVLRWNVGIDASAARFSVYRETDGGGRERIGTADPVPGGWGFAFIDREPPSGETFYWLRAIEEGREGDWTGPIRVGPSTGIDPDAPALALSVASAHPFRTRCELVYRIPARGHVRITVHSPDGSLVRSLVSEVEDTGPHSAAWDGRTEAGREATAGIYLVRLETGNGSRTMKIVRVR